MPHPRLNPLTALALGFSAWLLVLGVNQPWLSAAVVLGAVTVGTCFPRSAAVVVGTLALTVPTAASMVLIHAPHGEERIFPLVTADGLVTAGELSLRFAALIASLLAAVTCVRVPDLVKALQGSRLDHRVSYILGSALQFLPQGRHSVGVARDAQQLAGRRVTAVSAAPRLAVPVMTQLLTQGARRAEALESAGLELPGRRTVLRPVPDSRAQKLVRLMVPLGALAVVVVSWT